MFVNDQFITYSSPPHKRRTARPLAVVSSVILVLILFSILSNYRTRLAAGYDPLPPSSLVLPIAPLMLIGIGLWIGWGQTRIDLRRGVVERRPLGLPRPAKIIQLKDANRLYVGYYLPPKMVNTPNAPVLYKPSSNNTKFWFVRLEGENSKIMLIVQRSREEALAFARLVREETGLDVNVQALPKTP
ncbi:MAG: hypothetical protein P1U68_02260 [Verrucomicrobiales bacterium]|nr:hypothetical protein [Verrucomicrobiales bacterium]